MKYKRVLLKLSGEILSGNEEGIFSKKALKTLVEDIVKIHRMGADVAIVIGAGNIIRGKQLVEKLSIDRVKADYTGMLATVINGMVLQDMLEQNDCRTRMMTAINMSQVAEPFIRRKAISHLNKNRIIIFTGGTGNPFFTTDTASVLRAVEIDADVVLKGTKVDGVFNKDPVTDKSAKKFNRIEYSNVIKDELRVMDMTAISLSKENNIPIIVFNIMKEGNLVGILEGKEIGTLVS
ncbi:MAG: UMP kinase [candidate division WOR-3 bacterium]|nr:UMP kinase [candidate division WOR-3 bacterium]